MKRARTIEYGIDPTGLVWSRVGDDLAVPVLDYEGMTPENKFETKYPLQKMSMSGSEGVYLMIEWGQLKHTRKLPTRAKNIHREFWGMKPLKEKVTQFYRYEEHVGDDNDQSINDVIVEATSQEEADKYLERFVRKSGWLPDTNVASPLHFHQDRKHRYFHRDFYFQMVHVTITDAEKCRGRFHGYWDLLREDCP